MGAPWMGFAIADEGFAVMDGVLSCRAKEGFGLSEAGFLTFCRVAAEAEILESAACMAAFFFLFMPGAGRRAGRDKRNKIDKRDRGMLAVFFLYIGIYSANLWDPVSVNGWVCMLAWAILTEIILGWAGLGRKVVFLMEALFFSIRHMGMLIAESLHFVMNQGVMKTADSPEAIFRYAAATFTIAMAARFVLLALMLYMAGRSLPGGRMELRWKELCYLCLMPVAGILFGNIILRLYVVVKEDAYFQMYEQYPAFIGLVPLVAVLFYGGILVTFLSYREMARLQEERKKYFVEEQQISLLRERMEEVERFYDGLGRMKHELRNHLTNIRGLAVKGDYREMERYLSRISDSMNAFEFTEKTGNAVTDVIVNDKQKAAQKAGIRFCSEFAYPASDGYSAYDIGIILHNLLQNALEACKRMKSGEKYIVLSGRRKKKFFLMEVKNSFEGEVLFDKNTELPVSTKEKEPFLHGIGLSNVKREAEKYMGDVDIRVEGNEFRVTVLLQEDPAEKCQ